jgi:hypothetical protein
MLEIVAIKAACGGLHHKCFQGSSYETFASYCR